MSELSADRVIVLDDYIDVDSVEILETAGLLTLAPKNGDVETVYERLHDRHPALTVYRRDELPAGLHYRDNPRIAPIIGIPKDGWEVTTRARRAQQKPHLGAHGYDPRERSMGALFVAAGPGIAAGLVVPPFENVDIYNFLCGVLQLEPAKNDGSDRLWRQLLRH